jgi:5-methylcytosine-specific restriction endonuclease McrA
MYKRTPIRKFSLKKTQEIKNEKNIRKQLLERCKGLCEICGRHPDWRGLSPHEDKFRSQGGKMSLENSKMACGQCHNSKHNIVEVNSEPQWRIL